MGARATYTFRHFDPADLPALSEMGFKFFEQAKLPGNFNPRTFATFWSDTLGGGVGIVLIMEHDGGLIYPDPCTGNLNAQEMFWWVNEDHRGSASSKLIDMFESVAKGRGAVCIQMIAMYGMNHRALQRYYGARGYRPLEFAFVKEV